MREKILFYLIKLYCRANYCFEKWKNDTKCSSNGKFAIKIAESGIQHFKATEKLPS